MIYSVIQLIRQQGQWRLLSYVSKFSTECRTFRRDERHLQMHISNLGNKTNWRWRPLSRSVLHSEKNFSAHEGVLHSVSIFESTVLYCMLCGIDVHIWHWFFLAWRITLVLNTWTNEARGGRRKIAHWITGAIVVVSFSFEELGYDSAANRLLTTKNLWYRAVL